MINDRIKALIRDYNPWWEEKEIDVPEYKRRIFSDVQKYLKTKQIIAIVGLRRVGKTVLMRQIIKDIVKAGKENVFYFLFDELVAQNPDVLESILDYYLKTISKEGRKHIFLDEIQKVPYWQDVLKRFYDTRDDVKFIVSGSASLLMKKSKESLAGRIFDFYMPVLTFREFVELNGLEVKKTGMTFDGLKKIYDENIHKRPLFERLFLEYIFKGAFPEIAKEKEDDIVKSYIRSAVLEKIIFEDIPTVFNVKRKDILSSILEYCSKETSNLLDVTNLANVLGINYQTVKSYIFYLQSSFVLDVVYNYSRSLAKQLRKNKKVHIAHPSITLTIMRYPKSILDVEEMVGRYVESIVYQHSKLICEKISFWRTPQKEEVDLVLSCNGLFPIEVKYKSTISSSDVKSLTKFMNKFKVGKGVVVTKELFEKRRFGGKEILFVPAWLFLLAI
jgi:predicted AAA+ superfamily ATPase